MKTCNKLVAVQPFPTKSIKQVTLRGGLIGVAQKVELTPLQVLLPSEDGRFKVGMKVWVRGDLVGHDFANNIHTVNDLTFILLPDSYVQFYDGE